MAAIQSRVQDLNGPMRLACRALLRLAFIVERLARLRLGRFLFAPIRRRIAPHLRLLVSGGARLEKETEE